MNPRGADQRTLSGLLRFDASDYKPADEVYRGIYFS